MALTVDLQYSDDDGQNWTVASSIVLSGNGWVHDEECITTTSTTDRLWRVVGTTGSGTAQKLTAMLTYVDSGSAC